MTLNQTTAAARPEIRRADGSDREAIARLVGESFMDDPVSGWVFPDEEHRRSVHPEFFGVFLDLAMRHGWVDVTDDRTAAALWLPVTGEGDAEQDADDGTTAARLAKVGNERGGIVGKLTAAVHPAEPHYYLPIIAVDAARQGTGLGAALIRRVTDRCDREGMPAYLEASSIRSRGLYERLGFVFTGTTVDLPGGPQMWPMWREPRG